MPFDFWEVYTTMRKLEAEALAVQRENDALKARIKELEEDLKKRGTKTTKA